jgi:hypothetical protein
MPTKSSADDAANIKPIQIVLLLYFSGAFVGIREGAASQVTIWTQRKDMSRQH